MLAIEISMPKRELSDGLKPHALVNGSRPIVECIGGHRWRLLSWTASVNRPTEYEIAGPA